MSFDVTLYVMDVRWCDIYRMHEPAERINPDAALHAETPFVALLRLARLRITLLLRVLGGRRRIDDGVDHGSAFEHMSRSHYDAVDGVEKQLVQAVLLQQVPELQETLMKSTRADWRANQAPIEGEKCRNTLCISNFSQRKAALDLPSRCAWGFIQRFPK